VDIAADHVKQILRSQLPAVQKHKKNGYAEEQRPQRHYRPLDREITAAKHAERDHANH
jgi:hypothetical protein